MLKPPLCATIWKPSSHIPSLDGVRGLAILSVTFYRFGNESINNGTTSGLLAKIIEAGESGVDLFFVLSGFLITGVLLDAKERSHFFFRFFLRRTLRVFPLYYASLVAFLILVPWWLGDKHPFQEAYANQAFLWTYLTNVKMSFSNSWCFGYLGHFWSLAVEEHFYLAWPFAVYWLTAKQVFKLSILLSVASVLFRLVFALCYDNEVALLSFTVFRCEGLLMGGAIAAKLRAGAPSPSLRLGALCSLVASGIIAVGVASAGNKLPISLHTVISLFCASLLLLLLTSKPSSLLPNLFEFPIFRTLGKYSYAMYVFQSPLIPLASSYISVSILTAYVGSGLAATAAYITIMFAFTFLLGLFSWHLLEKQALSLRKTWEARWIND